jgi:hypothetical protein
MRLAEVLGILATVILIGAVAMVLRRQRVRQRDLGEVSERWVAHHRADRATE